MQFIELFAGKGGFRAGLTPLGWKCVGWVEWDKWARKAYEAIWPEAKEEWNAHDITTVSDDTLRGLAGSVGTVDLIAGGFPCQAFSVAGKRGGFEDTRGTLFFEVARFANVLRPKYLLLENVVGLLNHDEGRTFHTILCALDELGYDAEWQVLNATDFGIPQNRERVFIVGHLRGAGGRKVFPLDGSNREAAGELVMIGMLNIKGQDAIRRVYSPTGISPTLTTMAGGNREPKIIELTGSPEQSKRVYDEDGIAATMSTAHGSGIPKILQRPRGYNKGGLHDIAPTVSSHSYHENNLLASAILTPDREEKRQNGWRIEEPDEPMFTLTAQDKYGVMITDDGPGRHVRTKEHITPTLRAQGGGSTPGIWVPVVRNNGEWSERHEAQCLDANYGKGIDNHGARTAVATGTRIRKLTPRECWRLMGRQDREFDRAKGAGISDSQLYKLAGNGLIPQIVTAIAKRFEIKRSDTL